MFFKRTDSDLIHQREPADSSVCVPDALEQFLVLVYAGLTGSVTMITCTVLALTRLVFEYKGESPESHLNMVLVYVGGVKAQHNKKSTNRNTKNKKKFFLFQTAFFCSLVTMI